MVLGSSFGAFVQGFDASRQAKKDDAERTAANAMNDRLLAVMEKQADQAAGTQQILGAIQGLGATRGQGGGGDVGSVVAARRPTGANADYLRAGLVKRGMAPHVVDGWLMNFKDESGLNTSASGDNGNAFGLAQWNGPRMRALQSFASQRGVDASDADAQMDYLMSELEGSEAGAWKKIQATKTPGAAAAAILNHFERPAEEHRARREKSYLSFDAQPPALGAIRS